MTNDTFEDQLRAELRAATLAGDAAYRTVDTAAVIGAGTRIVRRRRAVGAVGALAAVTAVALGAYAVLGQAAPTALEVVPADSATVTSTSTPTGTGKSRELVLQNPAGIVEPTEAYVLTIPDPASKPIEVTVYAESDSGVRSPLGSFAVPDTTSPRAGIVTLPDLPLVAFATVPASATYYEPSFEAGSALTRTDGVLPGTQWRAIAFASNAPITRIDGLTWIDSGGAVRNVDGTVLPSVKIEPGIVVWVDPNLGNSGTVGTITTDESSAMGPLVQEGSWPTIFAQVRAGKQFHATFGVVLPEDTISSHAQLPAGIEGSVQNNFMPMGGGYALAYVQYDTTDENGPWPTISWRTAKGIEQSTSVPPTGN